MGGQFYMNYSIISIMHINCNQFFSVHLASSGVIDIVIEILSYKILPHAAVKAMVYPVNKLLLSRNKNVNKQYM